MTRFRGLRPGTSDDIPSFPSIETLIMTRFRGLRLNIPLFFFIYDFGNIDYDPLQGIETSSFLSKITSSFWNIDYDPLQGIETSYLWKRIDPYFMKHWLWPASGDWDVNVFSDHAIRHSTETLIMTRFRGLRLLPERNTNSLKILKHWLWPASGDWD